MRLPFGITISRDRTAPAIANENTTSNGTVIPPDGVQSSDLGGMRQIFGMGGQTSSGVVVSPENAMRNAAAYACTRIIAGGLAMMGLRFYRADINGQWEVNPEHPLRWLFNESPDALFTAAAWIEYMAAAMLLRGAGHTFMPRDRNGQIIGLMPLRPWNVVPRLLANRRLVYACVDDDGNRFGVAPDDMLVFPGFGFDGLTGMSVIQYAARDALGIAIAADDFSGRFYANGGKPPYALTHPGDIQPAQIDKMRAQWEERYAGAGGHRPLILTNGLDVKELSISAEDSQLLEARKFQVIDIARAFGVPPSMIGETEKVSSWGSGVEHMTLAFITFTLGPHIARIEQELNRKIFRTNTGQIRFNTRALLRLDSAARAAYYRQAMGGSQGPGWMTPNEVRREDELPPIEGGDVRFGFDRVPANTAAAA